MTVLTKRAVDVFAPTTAGGQLRGADMGESATWGTEIERAMEGAAAGRVDQATWAGLAAIAGTRPGQPAIVYGPDAGTHIDPVTGGNVPNVGEYFWSASPAGWRRSGGLQRELVNALNTGAGTANAVLATSDIQFSQAAYASLITVNFVATNTGPMTVSINGETPRELVTNISQPIPAGYVGANMAALVQIDSGGNYRLFSYGDATAIQAAAEAAAAAALGAMTAVLDPTFTTKAFVVTSYHPTVAPLYLHVLGDVTVGDGKAASYKHVGSEPSHNFKLPLTLSGGATAWYEGIDDISRPVYPPAVGGTDAGVVYKFFVTKAALRIGGSDPAPTNDEFNHWRGLPSPDAWGNPANIGLYSTAWNRNGASYGTYSNTFGHDCVAYGTASISGGAGSCTGDPDNLANPFTGYCSFAWGKNVQAGGEKSAAFNEATRALGRASFAGGLGSVSGPGLASHPNGNGGSGIVSDGNGAIALGWTTWAFGDGAVALGKDVRAWNGAIIMGSGINPGSPMGNDLPGTVGIGSNAIRPVLVAMPGNGTVGDYGYIRLRNKLQFTEAGTDNLFGEIQTAITSSGGGITTAVMLRARLSGSLSDVAGFYGQLDGARAFAPSVTSGSNLGGTTIRWYQGYFAVAPDISSDARLKPDAQDTPAAWVRAAKSVKPKRYHLTGDGEGAKWRIGYIAQDIISAFEAEGCDVFETNLISVDAEGFYGVNYTEFETLRAA